MALPHLRCRAYACAGRWPGSPVLLELSGGMRWGRGLVTFTPRSCLSPSPCSGRAAALRLQLSRGARATVFPQVPATEPTGGIEGTSARLAENPLPHYNIVAAIIMTLPLFFKMYSNEEFVSVTTQTTNGLISPRVDEDMPSFQYCHANLIKDLLTIIIALVGLAGNGVVISLLGCCMHRNAISIYILNLAVSDFLLLCCQFISSLLYIYCDRNYFIFLYIALFPYITGLSILSAISIERCLCVLWPIWYRCHRPKHMSAVMCALLWTLSLLFSFLKYYYSGLLNETFGFYILRMVDIIIVAWLIFLLLILSVSSLVLVVRIFYGSRRMTLTRLYVTILLTVLVYLICGLPFGIYCFLLWWLPVNLPYFLTQQLVSVTIILSCINSCANPIIYFLIGSFNQKHKSLKLVLQRALQDSL
ncbi:mas-related G-protein coupled receptor member X1-like [Octodon degus]|uniref:Mas-related G-protein coupled receptor member X1-like n=1 Tax=Octodon degus TaxID=10160 RepID=A0A6P3FDJ0_OCTDE|nr:mas-related G-protein coupled receptor member X1-like [Octodon degus]